MAILGLIAVAFLSGLSTASKAVFIADERATAENLAQSQMEYVKKQHYAVSYAPAPILGEYDGYSVMIDVEPLRDGNIQKITVTIEHQSDKEVTTLEDYKVRRG